MVVKRPGRVEVVVRTRVQKEAWRSRRVSGWFSMGSSCDSLAAGPASRRRASIVVDGEAVHQLADIVGADASVLQPEREVVIVETLSDKFVICSCE